MDALKSTRKLAKASLTRITNWLSKNNDSESDINAFKVREEHLNKAFILYSSTQDQIEQLDINNIDTEDRLDFESKYFDALAEFKNCIEFLSPLNSLTGSQPTTVQKHQPTTPTKQKVKLPEINIPTFSGNISKWESFFQLFSALIIDSKDLTNIERFIYLKTFLQGEPLKLIETLNLTHDNFQIALDILIDRYQNQFATINFLINALIDLPNLTKCTSTSLRDFITSIKRNLDSLKNLKCPVEHWDLLLLNILERKLDFGTRKGFESERNLKKLPTLDEFFKFLEKRCMVLENLSSSEAHSQKPFQRHLGPPPNTSRSQQKCSYFSSDAQDPSSSQANQSTGFKVCLFCSENGHRIYSCQRFKNLPHSEKLNFIHSKQMCTNCLGTKHSTTSCQSQGCSVCSKRHHTLLHNQNHNTQNTQNRPSHTQRQSQTHTNRNSQNGASFSALSRKHCQVLLATASVTLHALDGTPLQVKILLDSGSQNSFITRQLVNKLRYTPYERILNISGISQGATISHQMVDIFIRSNVERGNKFLVSCAILDRITCQLPQVRINPDLIKIPDHLPLADPTYFIPSEIDILIGADVYYDLLRQNFVKLGKNLPYLQDTVLGWVIAGSIPHQTLNVSQVNHAVPLQSEDCVALLSNTELNTALTKFWNIEDIPTPSIKSLTPDEKMAEDIFVKTTKVLKDGSFQVDLPFKSPTEYLKLGDSFFMAKKRFHNLERRLGKNSQLKTNYSNFIDDYVELNHAKFVPLELQNNNFENKYFLPHHCVIKENSISTKLRVVFDGSATSSSGYSLNDLTLKGYQVQPELFDILSRFRLFTYVLTTDIQQMYRQIKINPNQTFLQNIIWRETPNEPLKSIELSTVTYGTKSAPYLATRVLKEVALQNASKYPCAADALLNQCYVDDILTGCNKYSELECLYSELNGLLNSSGFKLHKWCTNHPEFLQKISPNAYPKQYDITIENVSNKILGLAWNPTEDYFSITLPNIAYKSSVTKREVLSTLAQMFDPLGLIGPVIVIGKIIMQKIWLSGIDWDQQLSHPLLEDWNTFIMSISHLVNLKIPRHLFTGKPILKIEMHSFADASMKAYAACVYIRTIYHDNSTSCCLVTSKSRIAPVKTVTLPRLELCAMHLAATLTKKTTLIFEHKLTIDSVNLWTDSQIALHWIRSHPSRWSVFVSNRVSKIQELSQNWQWYHVKSADNPADLLSRGVLPQNIVKSKLWWTGPHFLHVSNPDLSSFIPDFDLVNPSEERKVMFVSVEENSHNCFWNKLFSRFSTMSRLHRTVAFLLRFVNNLKINSDKMTGPLSVTELNNALDKIIKQLQLQSFSKEISELKNNKTISNKNILSLNPFLDKFGFLCVGGRLENANITYRQKHPILLPSKNHLVTILLTQEHIRLGHAGPQNVLSNVRLRFWPLNGLREVKRIIRKCVTCHRFRAQTSEQIMASLPKDRVLISRPFDKVGVDFGGPFTVKASKLRKAQLVKSYIAIFVCMTTKAVHIELVSDLSTDSFLMTLKRFISRRGNPSIIFSDNASNFLGARNQLREVYKFFKLKHNFDIVQEFLSTKQIEWKFIPPRSPHWGGIWEAAIKSAKYHLVRIIGNAHFTFEELCTTLIQIEAILNSRPLCPLSNDPLDLQCLTPGHFLIGRSLTCYPEPDVTHIPENRLTYFQRLTHIQQAFWKKWSINYLNLLQNRPKWLTPSPNLKINDIVLLKEDNTVPLQWPLARIVEVMLGSDGRTRVVKVKTQNGVFTRSISKLCLLPNQDADLI